jgi:hypothetical protein
MLCRFLSARPQFGERWARPWLDLARYADSHGFQRDNFRDIRAYREPRTPSRPQRHHLAPLGPGSRTTDLPLSGPRVLVDRSPWKCGSRHSRVGCKLALIWEGGRPALQQPGVEFVRGFCRVRAEPQVHITKPHKPCRGAPEQTLFGLSLKESGRRVPREFPNWRCATSIF